MSLKSQFKKALVRVANKIESGKLQCGKFAARKNGAPHCAIGWVAAETGVNPINAYELFDHFGFKDAQRSITSANDTDFKAGVVSGLKTLAERL